VKEIGEVVGLAFLLALFFLFSGEPHLWGKLHEKAMAAAEVKACSK
jgi:hypothetical protein